MTKEKFISQFGEEEMKVTSNFASKALGTNYNLVDTIIEFCDNSYDARIKNMNLNFVIDINRDKHTLSLIDDGKGIANAENLLKLGGTDKEQRSDAIGKFGVGVEGAISSIASQCAYDPEDMVEVSFISSNNGKRFEKHTAFTENGEQIIGKTDYYDCNKDEHFTRITFTNVELSDSDCTNICSAMEVTFEEPLQKNLNIRMIVNGNERVLGKSTAHTFVGDESIETVTVGCFSTDVKYRIIGGNEQSARSLDEAALRIYDKKSGRLLAKSTKYWKWFAGREAQQNICGLRAAIYIDSSIDCYKTFGISATKNGITWKDYYKNPDFAELKDKLGNIYAKACNTKSNKTEDEIVISGYTYNFTSANKMEGLYKVVEEAGIVLAKKKPSNMEIANLIAENIRLKKKCEKKSKTSKA